MLNWSLFTLNASKECAEKLCFTLINKTPLISYRNKSIEPAVALNYTLSRIRHITRREHANKHKPNRSSHVKSKSVRRQVYTLRNCRYEKVWRGLTALWSNTLRSRADWLLQQNSVCSKKGNVRSSQCEGWTPYEHHTSSKGKYVISDINPGNCTNLLKSVHI